MRLATWPIVALATGAFGIGATEFSPMGLLPALATGVGVSIPSAGLLVSAYAVGVMVGAPIMTLGLSHMSHKRALILLMAIFTFGNVLTALAPNYTFLLAARVFTSLAHGAFFGLGAVVATRLAPPGKAASAVSGMFMGLAVANIGGVPAATWVGQQIGWRIAFAGIAALGVVAILALFLTLPGGGKKNETDLRRELRILTKPDVLFALATTTASSGAMFTLYTYIVPLLAQVSNGSTSFATLALVLIGCGFTVGNLLGGRLPDVWLTQGLVACLAVIVATDLLFPLIVRTLTGASGLLFVWAVATFGIVPPLQARVMQVAAAAPGLASAVNIGAFNLGNALGAAVGGTVIAVGMAYDKVPTAAAAMASLSLVLARVASRRPIAGT